METTLGLQADNCEASRRHSLGTQQNDDCDHHLPKTNTENKLKVNGKTTLLNIRYMYVSLRPKFTSKLSCCADLKENHVHYS